MSGLNVRDGGASERSHRGEEGGEREEGRPLRGTGPLEAGLGFQQPLCSAQWNVCLVRISR